MDSKQLYIAAAHLTSTLTWNTDWIHFGTGFNVKHELINQFIDNFLVDETLNIVHERQDSGRHKKSEIKDKIQRLLGHKSFQLWNESLTRVIDFNRIGVLKLGQK